jgi:hypothetical protein
MTLKKKPTAFTSFDAKYFMREISAFKNDLCYLVILTKRHEKYITNSFVQ